MLASQEKLKKTYSAVPYMQIRGGSSKGVFFNKKDLPNDVVFRDEIILSIVGRDAGQIDGLGGANQLTSKVAIVGTSSHDNCDIDFLFMQVVVGENRVDSSPNCGNILAGVGVFTLESGLIDAAIDTTRIRVNMINSNNVCELVMQTPNKKISYHGDAKIDGVLGTSAPIICNYVDISGSICGDLFPTGNKKDVINGVDVSCIDNGMPVVIINAKDLGKTGYETCTELEGDAKFKQKLEDIRLQAGVLMSLGDVSSKVVPKMSLISPAQNGGNINTRTFIPHVCHTSIGVLGAVSVASACLYAECVTANICIKTSDLPQNIVVEHPSGEFSVELDGVNIDDEIVIKKAGLLRTARLISKGVAYPHAQILRNLRITL